MCIREQWSVHIIYIYSVKISVLNSQDEGLRCRPNKVIAILCNHCRTRFSDVQTKYCTSEIVSWGEHYTLVLYTVCLYYWMLQWLAHWWLDYYKFLNNNILCIRQPCQNCDGLFYSMAGKNMSERLIFKVQQFDKNIFPPWPHYLLFAIYVNTWVTFHILPARKKIFLYQKMKSDLDLEPLLQEVAADNFNMSQFPFYSKLSAFSVVVLPW